MTAPDRDAVVRALRDMHMEAGCSRCDCYGPSDHCDQFKAALKAYALGQTHEREAVVGYAKERASSLNRSGNPYISYEPDLRGAQADAIESLADDIESGAHHTKGEGK